MPGERWLTSTAWFGSVVALNCTEMTRPVFVRTIIASCCMCEPCTSCRLGLMRWKSAWLKSTLSDTLAPESRLYHVLCSPLRSALPPCAKARCGSKATSTLGGGGGGGDGDHGRASTCGGGAGGGAGGGGDGGGGG